MYQSEASNSLLRLTARLLVVLGCVAFWPALGHADWKEDVGFTQLQWALGSDLPDGSGVPISLVEAKDAGNYFPDINDSEFSDVTFLPVPLSSASNHATTQGGRFFGNTLSVAPEANTVTVYEADKYLNTVLNMVNSNSTTPDAQDFRVQNFSWIGELSSSSQTREALRRFDFAIERDNITALVGINNNTSPLPHFFSHSFNSIAVGRSIGNHSSGLTNLSQYVPGRSKPDLVAPISTSSGATAIASSAATFLHSINSGPNPVLGTDAENSEVIKAVLLAGATKGGESEFSGWSQFDSGEVWHPLDDTYGAGELNLYNSYLITRNGRGAGSTVEPNAVGLNGWDYQVIDPSAGDLLYELVIPEGSTAEELSVILTWNAQISVPFNTGTPVVADLSLEVLDSNGMTVDLDLDPSGGSNGYKEGLSDSDVDNVEHVYLSDLAAGAYTIKVSSADLATNFGLAWRTSTVFDSISADFDDDGDVDGLDFMTWQRGAKTLLGASRADGDANGDGAVDAEDLAIFNAQVLGGGVSLSSFAVAVPEPATWVAAVAGLLLLLLMRRRETWSRQRA